MVLQDRLPANLRADALLPGVQPLGCERWVAVDDAYVGQMAVRDALLCDRRDAVYWLDPSAAEAATEVLTEALAFLPDLGFHVAGRQDTRPDGRCIDINADAPLVTLGALIQEDICILQKRGDEHVLTGAVLCFPANWTLGEKAGRPLIGIHAPVVEYTSQLATRVQRLFDGVQIGRPLWRNNYLLYDKPDLFQPASEKDPPRTIAGAGRFIRAERQCILRLPETRAVIFSIHTYVVLASAV